IAAGDVVRGHEARYVIERTLGLDAFAAFAYGERDLRLPVDLLHAARDLDIVESAAQRARRLQKQIRDRRRLLAGKLRAPRGRHAGAEHLVDVFLEVLRRIEHFAGPLHRRKNTQTRLRNRGARRNAILLDESHHLLQHSEIGVPVFEEIEDAGGGAQGRTAARGTIGRVRGREVDGFVAPHESGEGLCACVYPRNRRQLERGAIHACTLTERPPRGQMAQCTSLVSGCVGPTQMTQAVIGRSHSALSPVNFTTLPHFSVSSAMSRPNSAGAPATGSPPISPNFSRLPGPRPTALI